MVMLARWAVRAAAMAATVLASVQPVLGAFAWFRRQDPVDYESLHLVTGGLLYNAAILLTVAAPLTRWRRRWSVTGLGVLLYALTHGQLRLGLASNRHVELLAYHVPLGVLIFFVAWLTLAVVHGVRFQPDEPA